MSPPQEHTGIGYRSASSRLDSLGLSSSHLSSHARSPHRIKLGEFRHKLEPKDLMNSGGVGGHFTAHYKLSRRYNRRSETALAERTFWCASDLERMSRFETCSYSGARCVVLSCPCASSLSESGAWKNGAAVKTEPKSLSVSSDPFQGASFACYICRGGGSFFLGWHDGCLTVRAGPALNPERAKAFHAVCL